MKADDIMTPAPIHCSCPSNCVWFLGQRCFATLVDDFTAWWQLCGNFHASCCISRAQTELVVFTNSRVKFCKYFWLVVFLCHSTSEIRHLLTWSAWTLSGHQNLHEWSHRWYLPRAIFHYDSITEFCPKKKLLTRCLLSIFRVLSTCYSQECCYQW